jgi:hypothetical protein
MLYKYLNSQDMISLVYLIIFNLFCHSILLIFTRDKLFQNAAAGDAGCGAASAAGAAAAPVFSASSIAAVASAALS